jgi:dihydropteroate synthase
VDIGGRVDPARRRTVALDEEAHRVLPVIEGLTSAGVPVSIDTMRPETARAAVAAGAVLVNDVSGGLADPRMAATVAELGSPVVMHWRAHSTQMTNWATYGPDVVADVTDSWPPPFKRRWWLGWHGIRSSSTPESGFAKESHHNWALLAGMDRLRGLGYPVLIGASRKRFLGELLAGPAGPRPVAEREAATVAVSCLAAAAGAWCVASTTSGRRDAI